MKATEKAIYMVVDILVNIIITFRFNNSKIEMLDLTFLLRNNSVKCGQLACDDIDNNKLNLTLNLGVIIT